MPVSALDIDIKDTNATGIENISEENKNPEISSETTVNTVEHSFIQDNVSSLSDETQSLNNDNLIPTENEENSLPIEEEKTTPDAISLQSDAGEDNEEEPSTDNWELGLVFYDSSVDNGKTPLTSIDWDASDENYKEGIPRVITIQINYKNTNAVTNYEPNDLEISIPNLAFSVKDILTASKILVSANTPIQSGEKWNFFDATTNPELQEIYKFKNAEEIGTANCEGSIQIQYQFIPHKESPERYEDSCFKSCEKGLTATMGEISSEEILFKVSRTYNHPWNRVKYDIKEYASKITSYDGLPANAADYIWVKYRPWDNVNYNSLYFDPYPNIMVLTPNAYIKGHLPEGCILFDKNLNQMDEIRLNALGDYSSNYSPNYFYIGYPKSVYNEENGNLIIENPLELWGRYENGIEDELLSECTIKINLADFEFTYSGNLYGIQKYCGTYKLYYQDIINNPERKSTAYFMLRPSAIYTGRPMTIKIGDDILYATTKDATVERLSDNDYKFTRANWNPNYLVNGNNVKIQAEKYDCELWVRYKNQEEYVLYDSFKNPQNSKTWSFTDDVVGFYFLVKDVTESFISTYSSSTSGSYCLINTSVEFKKKDIPESGKLYNFDYLQVYFKDSEDNLILQNEPGLDSYANFITKEQIANFDKDTYGVYLQRSVSSIAWEYYHVTQPISSIFARKEASEPILDTINEEIVGNCKIGINFGTELGTDFNDYYKEQYDKERAYKGFELYDLLPEGMEIASTKQQIIDSLEVPEIWQGFYDINFNRINTKEKLKEFVEPEVIITKNWKNTNRTMLKIIVNYKTPVWTFYQSYNGQIRFTYNYSISYDEYLDKGNVWENIVYTKFFDDQTKGVSYSHSGVSGGKEPTVYDNGYLDKDAIDLNENDKTSDIYTYRKINIIMSYVVSTHQDVSKYVKTDKSNYTSKRALASPDSEYTYKLRVRSGENNITNLIIYDSIEEYIQNPYSSEQDFITAYGNKKHWNGEFLGIDTSNAEKKGYKIEVYYSEDVKAGNLSEDNSWKEYSDSVDKSKVKSLAFEYLDESGEKAIIPANSQTYVLIKMKAPSDDTLKTLAYNGCRTQWVAIDENDKPVDFITGINSNIVRVSLNDYYDLTVNKVWDDENNKWGLRPDSIDIILKKAGVEVERKQITADNLSVTFSNLLIDDEKFYTIEEEPSVVYKSAIKYNELEDFYEITNTLKDDIFTDISGTKTWVGDTESKRPESITIKLLKDGEVYRTTTTSADKDWKYIFPKVPIYNTDETECIYSVEEVPVEKYNTQYVTENITSNVPRYGCFDIVNIYDCTDITGTKTWVGDTESKRPESITINLLKDGEIYKTTTATAAKEWKYTFEDVPIHNENGSECIYSVEEVPVDRYIAQYTTPSNGLAIKFNSQFRTESVSYDYVEIYYKQDGQIFKLGRWGGTTLAEQTVNVPTKDFYLYWRTDGSVNNYYGFSIDSIEAADVDTTGTAATLPNYTVTELTGNEYPETAHNPYPNSQNLLWHYTGLPDTEFNIINTYEGVDAINISFVKAIDGTAEAFDRLQLEKDALYKFQLTLTNQETGAIIKGILDNKSGLQIKEIPIGTYLIKESDDMYFDFVSMEALNSVEGVTFEKVNSNYILTITKDASEKETLQIKVNNKIEPDRPYEDKEEKENLFRIHKKDRPENPETSETTSTSETSTTTGTSTTSTGTSTTTTGTSTTSGSTTGGSTSSSGTSSWSTTGSGSSSTGTGGFCTRTYITGIGWTTTCYGRNSNNNEEIFSPEVPHNK